MLKKFFDSVYQPKRAEKCRRFRYRSTRFECMEGRRLFAGVTEPFESNQAMVGSYTARSNNKDLNLELKLAPDYNPTGSANKVATVVVSVTNPQRKAESVSVRLYWASGPSTKSDFVEFAGQRTVQIKEQPKADIGVWFSKEQISARPDLATHLVAVVNEDGRVNESNSKDNVRALELASRTFVFRISGWSSSSSSDLDTMDLSSLRTRREIVIAPPTIRPTTESISGESMLAHARRSMQLMLQQNFATAKDKVILIGHSYGGEIARRLAQDVFANTAGSQPAFGLVLVDPVDYVRAQRGQLNQSNIVQSLPKGVSSQRTMNISSNPDTKATIRGYQVEGVRVSPAIERLWYGDDNQRGTADDLTHTSIDNSRRVHSAILSFLRQQIS